MSKCCFFLLPLLTASLLAGCASSPPPEPNTVTLARARAERVKPALEPAASSQAFLVWTRGADDAKPVTHWLVPEGDQLKEAGRTEGVIVVANGGLWKLVEHPIEVETYNCDSILSGNPKPEGKGHSMRVTVERIGDRREQEIVKAPESEGSADFDYGVMLEGSLGPYLFLKDMLYQYSCGAHGSAGASFQVFDVASGSKVELVGDEEREKLRDRELTDAVEAFKLGGSGEPTERTESEITLAMYRPKFEQPNRLGFEYVFVTDACYACSSGEWGSYSQTVTIPSQKIPKALAAWEKTPPELGRWISAASGAPIGGWSALDGSESEKSALASAFDK